MYLAAILQPDTNPLLRRATRTRTDTCWTAARRSRCSRADTQPQCAPCPAREMSQSGKRNKTGENVRKKRDDGNNASAKRAQRQGQSLKSTTRFLSCVPSVCGRSRASAAAAQTIACATSPTLPTRLHQVIFG